MEVFFLKQFQDIHRAANHLKLLQQAQQASIHERDLETLSSTLEQKQRLIQQIMTFPQIRQEYQSQNQVGVEDASVQIEATLQAIGTLLNEIVTNENNATLELKTQQQNVSRELLSLQNNQSLTKHYGIGQSCNTRTSLDVTG